MEALLKIITDIECDFYIDYEYKEHLCVGSMSKFPIRKGAYIIEFKIDNVVIHAEEYYVKSNEEDILYKFQFIQEKESQIIFYESAPRKFILSSALSPEAQRSYCRSFVPTKKIDVKEDAFDQPILLNVCNEDTGKGMIIFKEAVTSIGKDAFTYCPNLRRITLPNSILLVEPGAFCSCKDLHFYGKFASEGNESLIVDGKLIRFSNCDAKTYDVPNGVTSIEESAFMGCEALTSVTLPYSLTTIKARAFDECCKLRDIVIPEGVNDIGNSAFSHCQSLENVSLPNSLIEIGEYAFSYCKSLKCITIPQSVKSIGRMAFHGCKKIMFYGKYTSGDNRSLIIDGNLCFFSSAGVVRYNIPDNVTSIFHIVLIYNPSQFRNQ